jgi:phosphocarrier protein HPr
MINKEFTIKNESGLHARPAGVLVKTLKPFSCSVILKHNGKEFNAKSVLGVMSACIKFNAKVEFICDGSDENECMKAIAEAIASGLGE